MQAEKLSLTKLGASHSGGLGGGTQQSFIRGGSSPRSQPVTLLYTIFDRKGIPFIYLLLTNGTPFIYRA